MTTAPTIESLNVRLDAAGSVMAKLMGQVDVLVKQHEQLARDYMDSQLRLTRIENQAIRNRQSIDGYTDVMVHVVDDNVKLNAAVRRDHEWIQELLRFKHDAESNGQFRREAQA